MPATPGRGEITAIEDIVPLPFPHTELRLNGQQLVASAVGIGLGVSLSH